MRRWFGALLLLGAALFGAACGAAPSSNGAIGVVAAENTWGSLVSQLGGTHVRVTSIIKSQDVDPHDYEAIPSDGRAVARARYVLINGLGYDEWADRLVAANASKGQRVLRVQDVLGLKDDANPHRWYSPTDVLKVIDQITADLKDLDAAHAADYDAQRAVFLDTGLQQYRSLSDSIRRDYPGAPVGATESVVEPLVEALGLKLLTPPSFMNAVSEGVDPTPQDKATMESQIRQRQIRVLLVNRQNSTPDVQRLIEAARASNVPVVEVTETPSPPDATFQDWQSAQLQALANALKQAR